MARVRNPSSSNPTDLVVDQRAQALLKLVVERYIEQGTPVASKALAELPSVGVSSATVRNIMGDLESLGLVTSPHTSAGKIPTPQGLRFFVDTLLAIEPLDRRSVQVLEQELNPDLPPKELVASASKMLSHITQMTCVVTTPRRDGVELRQVEFLKMGEDRVLVILVLSDREVQNRVIRTDRDYTEAELTAAANFINEQYRGKPLLDVRSGILDAMQADKDRMDSLMQAAIDIASRTFEANEEDDQVVVSGRTNLLDVTADPESVRNLFAAFSEKSSILHLLDRCLESDGIQLFIGQEAGAGLLDEVSLITAPYEVQGEIAGVLGVIGPTRMAYQDVIPVVDVTAKVLGAAIRYV